MRILTFSLSLLPLIASLMGCGSDDNGTIPAPESQTIAEIVAAEEDFSTLETAVTEAGLADTLQGAGSFTVFAPTNAAFAALPAGTLDTLLAEPEGDLKEILLYHVVSGELNGAQVATLAEAATLLGKDVAIEVKDGKVYLNGNTQVTMTDIEASNGVIHVIDAVLLPPAAEPVPEKTIAEIVVEDARFDTLEAAVVAAGLAGTLAGAGPFTVFAPTDDAFKDLPTGTLESLFTIPTGALREILDYHVVAGSVKAAQVVTLTEATTIQGEDVDIELKDGKIFLNDTIQVIITDIEAVNGVIHVIDGVLIPDALVIP